MITLLNSDLLPADIAALGILSMERIEKGWSGETKYRIQARDGKAYLLRLSAAETALRKAEEISYMKELSSLDFRMSVPLYQGMLKDQSAVASLYTWVEGRDLDAALAGLSEKRQYETGLEAGRILALIHGISARSPQEDWLTRFSRKIDAKIKLYLEAGLNLPGAEKIISVLKEGKALLHGRPQSYHHGDFHAGNLLLSDNGELGVIDFNRFDFGDPWEEFNRIVWCAQASFPFAKGRIDGYFDGKIPDEFWPLLRVYIGNNLLASVAWAGQFGASEEKVMLRQYSEVMSWYDQMDALVPAWMFAYTAK